MSGGGAPFDRRDVGRRDVGRRAVILAIGGVGAGIAVSACSGSAEPARLVSKIYDGDLRTIALAAALENQAVSVYRTLRAALAGLHAPAFATLVDACVRHHAEHAAAWNGILRAARKPAVAGVPLTDRQSVMATARSITTVSGAAALALALEVQAQQTYVVASGSLTSAAGVAAAASIAPVEAMHAAMLRFIAGQYPVPASFAGTSDAARLSTLTA